MSSSASAPESDRLKKLRQQQEELLRKIRAEESRLKDQSRKDDTRRKIIVGAIALAHRERNPQFGKLLDEALDLFVEADKDRELLGLSVKIAPLSQTPDTQTSESVIALPSESPS